MSVPRELFIEDREKTIQLKTSSNIPDAVLWNPWIERTKKFSDLCGYEEFVCLEVGAIEKPIHLRKGEKNVHKHEIVLVKRGKL